MLDLPFFDDDHRQLAARLDTFVAETVEPRPKEADEADPARAGRELIRAYARERLLTVLAPDERPTDLRAVCLAREALASASALADAVFAVQGLGSYPILITGDETLRRRYLPRVVSGDAIAAFALTEADAGSDVRALRSTARWDQDAYVLDGTKTLISNAGIADFYVVFARTDSEREQGRSGSTGGDDALRGKPGLTAFVVDADSPGVRVVRSIPLLAPYPIGEVSFEACRIPPSHRLGEEGGGYRLALRRARCEKPGATCSGASSSAGRWRSFRPRSSPWPTCRWNSTRPDCWCIARRGGKITAPSG